MSEELRRALLADDGRPQTGSLFTCPMHSREEIPRARTQPQPPVCTPRHAGSAAEILRGPRFVHVYRPARLSATSRMRAAGRFSADSVIPWKAANTASAR